LTGVDAANALDAFFATQIEPPDLEGFGPTIETAFQIDPTTGLVSNDITSSLFNIVSVPYTPVSVVTAYTSPIQVITAVPGCAGLCTVWTPIAHMTAPEISPASMPAALTLLFGSLAVLRGRRPPKSAA
jgi:hypothetical protein